MTKRRVNQLATQLIEKHGLRKLGWKFNIYKPSETFPDFIAFCSFRDKTINYNSLFISCDDIHETLLHEIAHALSPSRWHDEIWKAKYVEIGGSGENTGRLLSFTREAIVYGFGSNFEMI